ncbi:CIC11C00000000628 [Sungouiella intermedia]|uniref:CIC11C00000000628 n=1 Tax=Sungouiella intermedia TaxID=45354 RepID=A0A1L0CWX7_9ASCO|nr:CIC11C00000000628 [[Candida] intermedia]
MWCQTLLLASCINLVFALWGTYYSFSNGKIYMKLKNNDLVALNFSITGFDDLNKYSHYSIADINIQQNQEVSTLSLPPTNSSVFLYNSNLYAFTSGTQDSSYDICGDGVMQLLKYDSHQDAWVSATDNLTFSDVSDISFYQDSSYLVTDDSSTVYIYGGRCSSGSISSRMLSLDMDTMTLANISTSTKPQAFYGASNLWAPNPQNQLVIGGRAASGWINMYQLATWNSQSGWLFELVAEGNTIIGSRINPLVLPIFSPLADNTTSTFTNNYKVTDVLAIGGESAKGSLSNWSKLSISSNQWEWSTMNTSVDASDVLGAAVIFDTLVVVNGSSLTKRDTSTSYTLSLYDITSLLKLVTDLKSNTVTETQTSHSSSSSHNRNTIKIVIGVLVPIVVLSLLASAVFYYLKKRSTNDEKSLHTVDYPLGHFRTALDFSYDPLRPHPLYKNSNDTASTLEVGSIDSWVRKRQEYDAKRLRTLKRHSFLASNETLNGHLVDRHEQPLIQDELGESGSFSEERSSGDMGRLSEGSDGHNSKERYSGESSDRDGIDIAQEMSQVEVSSPRKSLHKSFSYSHTPPHLPRLKKSSRLDPGFIDLGNMLMSEENIDDSDSFDENMDVQVLVSSKRKSVLRVMNPDKDTLEIRLRAPSK